MTLSIYLSREEYRNLGKYCKNINTKPTTYAQKIIREKLQELLTKNLIEEKNTKVTLKRI